MVKEGVEFVIEEKIPSTLKSINKMLNGGYIPGVLYTFFGPPASGKTILCLQEAFGDCLGMLEKKDEEKSILIVDTEGGMDGLLQEWYDIFADRFGIRPKVILEHIHNLFDLLEWFGYPCNPTVSEKGQLYIRPKGVSVSEGRGRRSSKRVFDLNAPVIKYCEKYNVGTVLIDSITEPLDGLFAGGPSQFPGRGEAINAWFGRIHWLAQPMVLGMNKRDIPRRIVRCIVHETSSPENTWVRSMLKGGANLAHKFKVVIHMSASSKKGFEHVVKATLARYFSKKAWSESVYIILTDAGIIDPSREQAEKLWSDSKLFADVDTTWLTKNGM